MECSFKSTKMGRTVKFIRNEDFHVFVDIRPQPGTPGRQIFIGGRFTGNPVVYAGKDEENFRFICRLWLNYYLKGVY